METEVYIRPTAQLREQVQNFTGGVFRSLFDNREYIYLVIICLILFFVLRTLKYARMKAKAKRNKPDSTNTWFKWEEFRAWQKEEEKRA